MWAGGKQAFSVSRAHPAQKHSPSVWVRGGVGSESNPSRLSDCRATTPQSLPPPHYPCFAYPSLPCCPSGEGLPAGLGTSQLGFDLEDTILPSLGRALGKPLAPPPLSILCPLRNEPHRHPAKLKILKCKQLSRGCPLQGGKPRQRKARAGLAPSAVPLPPPHPYISASKGGYPILGPW